MSSALVSKDDGASGFRRSSLDAGMSAKKKALGDMASKAMVSYVSNQHAKGGLCLQNVFFMVFCHSKKGTQPSLPVSTQGRSFLFLCLGFRV